MKTTFKKLILGFLALSAIIMGAAALSAPAPASPAVAVPTEVQTGGYYLRDWQGYIAVFEGNAEAPASLTDIETGTLNDVDREKLQNGIPAQDKTELLSLLEDLSS